MLDTALRFIETLEENGFEAYIVGGLVRDYYLGIESNDIDVCTNARPSDVRNIFKDNCVPNDDYGSVTVNIKNTSIEVTTYRKEIKYVDNRRPSEYFYIDNLLDDLKRRDFNINTLCMNKNKEIIDLLNGRRDLEAREINTVGDSYTKFSEDALRILRAVRFATILNFKLSDDVKESIMKTKHLLKNLSYERKKEELNKIFASIHVRYGVMLLLELGLDKELELDNLRNIKNFDDLMGIWALLDVCDIYPFSKNEKEIITDILETLNLNNLDPMVLYKYGLYVNIVSGGIKNIDKKQIAYVYDNLPIKSISELNISGDDVMAVLKIEPGKQIKDILDDVEEAVVRGKIENDNYKLKRYIDLKYSSTLK